MANTNSLKIYFAYSGEDKEGFNPVQTVIEDILRPESGNQPLAKAMPHPGWSKSNQKKDIIKKKIKGHMEESNRADTGDNSNENVLQQIMTAFRRSFWAKWLNIILEWSLGQLFMKNVRWRRDTQNWRIEAEKLIEESDFLVFLYSRNSMNEANSANIKWEIETAKRLDRNVILCNKDRLAQEKPPEWVKKVDEKAVSITQKELRERIIRHNLKEYNFTSLDLNEIASNPDSKEAERIFEQYKMYKEETENLVNTRQTASNFFLAINGALLTLIGVILDPEQELFRIGIVLWMTSAVGIVISNSWSDMVNYYKNLNTAKQRLINAIEKSLPLQLNYTEYYDIVKDPLNKGRQHSFGEAMIPNMIHSGWGFLFLISTGYLTHKAVFFLWSYLQGRAILCILATIILMEPFIESMLHSRRRKKNTRA